MNTTLARVLRVLTGHSATAMIHAVDERGHELKLEVPTELTRAVAPGRVLVFQWSVHGLPEAAPESASIEVVPLVDATPAPATTTSLASAPSSPRMRSRKCSTISGGSPRICRTHCPSAAVTPAHGRCWCSWSCLPEPK